MSKLVIYGGSHAANLAKEIVKNKNFSLNFKIISITKPGATLASFPFPNLDYLTSNDICVVQCFGNSLFKKNIKITYESGKKTIHLLSYCPLNQKEIEREYLSLEKSISLLQCKIYVIDNFIRHARCCKEHRDKRIPVYQIVQNKRLFKHFSKLPNVTVLDHKALLGIRMKKLKNNAFYGSLLKDSVHLKRQYYSAIIANFYKTHMLGIVGPVVNSAASIV